MAFWRRGVGTGILMVLMVIGISLYSSSIIVKAASKKSFVRKTIKSHEIVVFSKSYCPYCKRAKGIFKELGKMPYVVELDEREDGSDIQDAMAKIVGRRTVPQVFINGKHIGGSDDTLDAFESGKLAELLGIESKDDL
ncbi:Glutaredoxin-C4 [Zostera marina]|uniref:Glutaredoxin-C4 n=1 Tax=Zostera marina TaxID=29655 RepID=A0A0K9NHR6_ZOSMR|nr:Glutaredoxin-C4 [Zostera marina]